MTSMRPLVAMLALAAVSAPSGPCAAAGDDLYSINALTGSLVRLDTETGAVTVVGHLGFSIGTWDLAYHDGVIYALEQFGKGKQLHAIDPESAVVSATVTVSLGGTSGDIGRATGLAVVEGSLVIGFSPDPPAPTATHLGRLLHDGTIIEPVDLSALGADFYALTHAMTEDTGTFFSVPGAVEQDLFTTTLDPIAHTQVAPAVADSINDAAFKDGELWVIRSIAQSTSALTRLDPETGAVLETTMLDVSPGQALFMGLASVPTCAADVDQSGDVGFDDLLAVLATWGPCAECPTDIDGDGDVGFGDLLEVLASWGPC